MPRSIRFLERGSAGNEFISIGKPDFQVSSLNPERCLCRPLVARRRVERAASKFSMMKAADPGEANDVSEHTGDEKPVHPVQGLKNSQTNYRSDDQVNDKGQRELHGFPGYSRNASDQVLLSNLDYSHLPTGRNFTQTGAPTSILWPVGESLPVSWSIRKTTTLSES